MRKTTAMLVVAAVLVSFQGCQSLSRGKTQHIPTTSRPAGVRVIVDGKNEGTTPVNLKLLRRDIHVIRFELEGYRPVEVRVSKKRASLGETIFTSAVWAPIGGVALGLPIFVVWRAAAGPAPGEWGDMERGAISILIGAVIGWTAGTIIDATGASNFDLAPRTIFVEMDKADGSKAAAPAVVWLDPADLLRLNWIRISVK